MKIRISRAMIPDFIFFIILVANISFFNLPGISDALYLVAGYHFKRMILWITLLVFGLLCIKSPKFIEDFFDIKQDPYGNLTKYYLMLAIVTMVCSLMIYPIQNLAQTIQTYYYYMILLLYFILIYWMRRYPGFYERMCSSIVWCGTVYSIYLILAKILYDFGGRVVFSELTMDAYTRSGVRFSRSADFCTFAALVAFCIWMNNTKKKKYLIGFLVNTCCVFFAGQTRMLELSLLVGIAGSYLYCTKMTKKKMGVIVAVLVVMALGMRKILNFVDSFSLSIENNYSTSLRMEGWHYYIGHMLDHGLLGIGLIANDAYRMILTGRQRISFVITDMGYAGFLGEFGILGVSFLVFLIFIIGRDLIRIKKRGLVRQHNIVAGMAAFWVLSLFSLMFNDVQRIVFFPICMAIFSYHHKEMQENR